MNNVALDKFAEAIVSRLVSLGASDAECAVSQDVARQVSIREGEIEKAESASGCSIALRAYIGQQTAAAEFSLDPAKDYTEALEALIATAKATPADPFCGLADRAQLQKADPIEFDQYDPSALLSIDDLKARAREIEKAASGKELRVDQSGASHGQYEFHYFASNGFSMNEKRSYASQSVVAIHDGKELVRDYASDGKVYLSDLESPEETGKRAHDRTLAARNPIRPPSGKFPVFFDERISSSIIGHLLSAMNASSIARRTSWLIDYDAPIFPKSWKLIETPHRKRRMSSALYDGEGFVKKEAAIIAEGRPQLWISNLSSARQLDMPPTGHATRSGVNTGAGISAGRLEAHVEKREKLLASMGEGLLVTGFIGATINPHTGDYSRGVNGFWVRNGEIAEAVNEATIAGNLKEMLPELRAADDADEDRNMIIPSLLVQEMTIAGA